MLKGIIFDADGTLLDSMPIWHEVSRLYLERRGIEAPQSLVDKVFTMTLAEGCAYIKKLYGLPDPIEEVIDGITSEIRNFYYYDAPLKPGAREFLSALSARDIPVVIATAGLRETLEAALRRLGIMGLFDKLFFCTELSTSKREPYIYNLAAEHLRAEPREICVFEDALYAVKTAKSAGFRVIGVADESEKDKRDEIISIADRFIRDYSETDLLSELLY